MTKDQIDNLIQGLRLCDSCSTPELIETHISWVVLCDEIVYKIKKPISYSFLDFSSIKLRKEACEKEVKLNRRLAPHIYLGVVPIRKEKKGISIESPDGVIEDYAVKMKKIDNDLRMDHLLERGKVSAEEIEKIASMLVAFHRSAKIIDLNIHSDQQERFDDLSSEAEFISSVLGKPYCKLIETAIFKSEEFNKRYANLLKERLKEGMVRDCHGDLHSRNIFLIPEPIIYDCLEFNDRLRYVDILDELAFFALDLDAFGHPELAEVLLEKYFYISGLSFDKDEKDIFTFFKAYRANIRAKVSSLRLRDQPQDKECQGEIKKYLQLMMKYLEEINYLKTSSGTLT